MPYGAPPGHGRGPRPPHPHGNHGPKSRHSHKRDHSAAFNKPQSTVPRTPAPPSVPSFGNPLPCKPPPAADATRKPKKRKRKHNLLGLTPKTEEHESSEEEEEVDEESKLASSDGTLQFTYKGQTATLQTASDIASWIAERKKKFPTAARIEEKKKAGEEAKAARDALRREKEKAKQQEKQEKLEKQGKQGKPKDEKEQEQEQERKLSDVQADPAIDAAMKAQRKADKIRRNLDREQKRFAKAEAEAEAARLKVAALQKQVMGLGSESSPVDGAPESEGCPATCNGGGGDSTSTGAAPTEALTAEALTAEATVETMDADLQADSIPLSVEALLKASADGLGEPGEAMDIDSDDSGSSDWTSSSGSESEPEEDDGQDDDDDGDSAPEVASSRREGPERVPPPPREVKKPICRHFARTGQCNRGDKCKFLHDTRERGTKAKAVDKKGRKGLFQAVSIIIFFPPPPFPLRPWG